MSADADLLKAVIANPDADEPRLAYASWCASQASAAWQARGAFVRNQISAELSRNDVRSYTLFAGRADEGLRKYAVEWALPCTALGGTHARFHRGFVELVRMPAPLFLRNGEALLATAPIRHLELSDVVPVARELFESPLLGRIRSLELERTGITDNEIRLIAQSTQLRSLRWLGLAHNQIGEAGAEMLARSPAVPSLAYVEFTGNPFAPAEDHFFDNGYVVDSGLNDDGLALERRCGKVRWLHHKATSVADQVPDRFRIRPAA